MDAFAALLGCGYGGSEFGNAAGDELRQRLARAAREDRAGHRATASRPDAARVAPSRAEPIVSAGKPLTKEDAVEMLFKVATVGGAVVTPDGARIDIELLGARDERLIVRLPVEQTAALVALLCGVGGSAQEAGHRIQQSLAVEKIVLRPDPHDPEMVFLVARLGQGLNIALHCSADRIATA